MIAMEGLKGIRRIYRKGNCQERKYGRRLNCWQYYELQGRVEYKARWVGLPVEFADPRRTSRQCPGCEKILQEDTQRSRKMLCANSGLFMDGI